MTTTAEPFPRIAEAVTDVLMEAQRECWDLRRAIESLKVRLEWASGKLAADLEALLVCTADHEEQARDLEERAQADLEDWEGRNNA